MTDGAIYVIFFGEGGYGIGVGNGEKLTDQ